MHYKSLLFATLLSIFSLSSFAETVNINKADASAFQHYLKGIGVKKAAKIIKYRTAHKEFKTIAEIMEVNGIGKGIFKKIKTDLSLTEGEVSVPSKNAKVEVKAKTKVKIKINDGTIDVEVKEKKTPVVSTTAEPAVSKLTEKTVTENQVTIEKETVKKTSVEKSSINKEEK